LQVSGDAVRYSDDANVEPEEREVSVPEPVETVVIPDSAEPQEASAEPSYGGVTYEINFVVTEDFREGIGRFLDALERMGYTPVTPSPEDQPTPFVEVPGTGYMANLRDDGTWSTFARVPKKLPPGN